MLKSRVSGKPTMATKPASPIRPQVGARARIDPGVDRYVTTTTVDVSHTRCEVKHDDGASNGRSCVQSAARERLPNNREVTRSDALSRSRTEYSLVLIGRH